jgi:hypothetical protein
MNAWYRDQSGHLIKIEFEVCSKILFESSVHSQTLGTMADHGSNHGENENLNHNDPPMRSLRKYLQPPHSSTPSCIIFPHQGNNLISNQVRFHYFLNSMVLSLRILICT